MQTLKIALTIIIALFLQMLLPNYLGFFRYIDLPLLVTVYLSLQRAPLMGMLSGTVVGLGGDAVAGGILGVGGFAKTLIGYVVSQASVRFSLENWLARMGVVAVSSLANTGICVGLYLVLEQNHFPEQVVPLAGSWSELLQTAGWKVVGDTGTAFFAFALLDRIFHEQKMARNMAIKKRFYE